MKMRTLAVLAGVATPLIATTSASAGFTGIKVTGKPNELGLLVCNVYAIFDRPGEDFMLAVAGTPNNPLDIHVNGGTFYQSPFGTDLAPLGALITPFPSLAYDTFVTIGVKQVGPSPGNPGQPVNNTVLTAGWPGFGPSALQGTNLAWFVIPSAPQADPFDPVNSFPGNGQILIGQFSTANGTSIEGTMLLQYISNDVQTISVETFFHVPSPGALAMMGAAGLIGARGRRRDMGRGAVY